MSDGERQAVSVEARGPLAIIRFHNRADGTMDGRTETGLESAVEAVENDPSIRAVILTGGVRGVFIRHYNLAALAERGTAMAVRGLTFREERPVKEISLHRALRRMEASPKPFIAALNGVAMGGGFEVALACDLRIAESGSYAIGLPEINLGILPGAGGVQRLTRLLGGARAIEIIMLGRTFSPQEAERRGLVHECVGDAEARAIEIGQEICRRPAKAVAYAKRLVRGVGIEPQDNGFAAERTLFCDLLVSAEAIAMLNEVESGRRDIRASPGPTMLSDALNPLKGPEESAG